MDMSAMIVTVVMAILEILEQIFEIHIGFLSQEWISAILAVLWPILVWLVPAVSQSRSGVLRR